MRNGFYTELDALKRKCMDSKFEDAGWDFLENKCNNGSISAYSFLHGLCWVFALVLNEIYGYRIVAFHDPNDGSLIHAYCETKIDRRTLYVDVRGCTDNYKEFMEDFDDWIDYDMEGNPVGKIKTFATVKKALKKSPGYMQKIDKKHIKAAKNIIKKYRGYYEI